MGFRVSWLAQSGTSTEDLLQVSGQSPTGERHAFPDLGLYLLELPNVVESPWVLLIADGSDYYANLESSHAQKLSENGNETLFFGVQTL